MMDNKQTIKKMIEEFHILEEVAEHLQGHGIWIDYNAEDSVNIRYLIEILAKELVIPRREDNGEKSKSI